MPNESWLAKSGQRWKAWLAYSLLAVGGVGMLRLLVNFDRGEQLEIRALIAYWAVGCSGFVWLAAGIRCSECGTRVGWHLMRTMPVANWFVLLHRTEACPKCGAPRTIESNAHP